MPRQNNIQFRKGTALSWTSSNPILASGEPGFENDTLRLKIGNGSTSWNDLNYSNIVGSGSSNYLPRFTGVNLFTNSTIYDNGTNVGIGTTNPNSKLHVNGSGYFSSGLNVSGLLAGVSGSFDTIIFNNVGDPDLSARQLGWNNSEGSLALGVSDTHTIFVGEEMLYRVRNNTGSTLLAGSPVYASGLTPGGNNRIEVAPHVADGNVREIRFMGLMMEDCSTGVNGYATHFGYIRNIDTRGDATTNGTTNKLWTTGEPSWTEGDILYVHPTVAGKLTKIEPKHSISVAIILNRHQNQGKLFVRPLSYGHLNDIHDVNVSGATDGQFLQYNAATDYWVPSSSGNFTSIITSSISGADPLYISSSTAGMIINDLTIFLQNDTKVAGYLRIENETPDTIAIFNNDKDVVSLISPTLTELSYVSGVNSNIQTQLDSKQATLTNPVTGTGVANHIPYWSSTSGLLADSNQLIWDSTNNRLGIGTSSPRGKLDITGGLKVGGYSDLVPASGSELVISNVNSVSGTSVLNTVGLILQSNGYNTDYIRANNTNFRIGNNLGDAITVLHSNNNIGIGTTNPTYKLQVNGNFGATTKSFRIDHPSKEGYSLEYGSLESPYHGVRLTGRGKVINGVGIVELPYYLKDLIHNDDSLTIQLTNYKHGKTLYVSDIDLQNDKFAVKADRAKTLGELEFFWSLTGTRKDVENLVVEKEN